MENWWLKTMDKKIKIWHVHWTVQVELNGISFTNVLLFNNKSFKLFNFDCCNFSSTTYRSSHRKCSVTKSLLRNFPKFTGKHLCQSLFFDKVSEWRCPVTKGVLRIFANFTGKHLCQSPFFNKVADLRAATLLKKRLWHRCFPVNFAKFLRSPFVREQLWWLILNISFSITIWNRYIHQHPPTAKTFFIRNQFIRIFSHCLTAT